MSKSFLFLDLETTGLDPKDNHILEVGWILTNENFDQLRSNTFVVDHGHGWGDVFHDISTNSVVEKMHAESGLLEEMHNGDIGTTLWQIADSLYADLEMVPSGDDTHLAGFSVEFDRGFLQEREEFDPLFGEDSNIVLHHRLLNLSAFKLMYETAGVDLPTVVNPTPHRALADCQEALQMARVFRDDIKLMYGEFI